jgi:uncharacterized SAM-binding protein YcdF (DUF218 family)
MDWTLFVFKKIVSATMYPTGITLLLLAMGIIAWLWKPQARIGISLVVIAWGVLLISSLGITGNSLIYSLEQPFGKHANPKKLSKEGVKYIVVLGGGVNRDAIDPIDAVRHDSLTRVVEGIRLYKGIPGSKLVLSGGKYTNKDISSAEAMAGVAQKFGVPRDDIILEDKSWDTDDEARFLRSLLGRGPFALVTSAFHMKRALLSFRRFGLNPVPAPTDFKVKEMEVYFATFLPCACASEQTEFAMHEYLGIAWTYLKDLLDRPLATVQKGERLGLTY